MTLRVSFVIPVYNVEKYLCRCIDSIYAQGLKEDEYEIILVNDGSTDNSYNILCHYATNNSNIVLINQDNQGVSSARNAGINRAKGDFICFVDSDDYLNPGGINYIFQHFNTDVFDIIRFWSRIELENDSLHFDDCRGEVLFSGYAFDYLQRYGIDFVCWCYLYKTEWLRNNTILFSNHRIAEDYLFISKVLLSNPKILSTSCLIYRYVKHETSVTGNRSLINSTLCVRSFLKVFNELFSFADFAGISQNQEIFQVVKYSAQDKMRSFMSRVMTSRISITELREIISRFKELGIIPVRIIGRKKDRFVRKLINVLLERTFLIYLMRPLYRSLFIPYVLPSISKN